MSTDLQTTDNNGLQWVKPAPQNSAIAKALLSPLVNQVSPEDVFKVLNVAIGKAYIDTGYRIHPDDATQKEKENHLIIYNNMVNELVYYVRQYASTYRLKELPIAIERGTQKEYGDYFGLNKTSFIQFIKGYKASEARAQALEAHLAAQDTPPTPPTIEQQFETDKATALETFTFHQNKDALKFDTRAAHVYDFLNSLGLITYTKDEKEAIFSHATSKVIAEKENQRYVSDLMQRHSLAKLIEKFKLIPEKGTTEHGIIVSKAKAITTAKYFDDLFLTGYDLAGVIEGKRAEYIKSKRSQ